MKFIFFFSLLVNALLIFAYCLKCREGHSSPVITDFIPSAQTETQSASLNGSPFNVPVFGRQPVSSNSPEKEQIKLVEGDSNVNPIHSDKEEGCEEFWSLILSKTPMVEPGTEGADYGEKKVARAKQILHSNQCKIPKQLENAHAEFLMGCIAPPFNLSLNSSEPSPPINFNDALCLNGLDRFRSSLIDWQTQNTPIRAIHDTAILSHKLIAIRDRKNSIPSGFDLNTNATKYEELDKQTFAISYRMLELNPRDSQIGKFALDSALRLNDKDPEIESKFTEITKKILEGYPNDLDLEEKYFTFMSRPGYTEADLQKFKELFPNSGLFEYFKASQIDSKDRYQVFKWIRRGLGKDPRNLRLQRCMESLVLGRECQWNFWSTNTDLSPEIWIEQEQQITQR